MPQRHPKVVTLDGLGPLSRPRVFRVYGWLFTGAVLYGHTLLIAKGYWVVPVVAFVGAVSIFRALRRNMPLLAPRAASVDATNLVGGWLIAAVGAVVYLSIVDGPSAVMALQVALASVIASIGFLLALAFGQERSLRRPWEPNNVYDAKPPRILRDGGETLAESSYTERRPSGRGW